MPMKIVRVGVLIGLAAVGLLFSGCDLGLQAVDAEVDTATEADPIVGTSSIPDPFTANVMAPLRVSDWSAFENQLAIAAAIGVDAVSVDVWWGDVEAAGDQVFDWSYYDTIFQKITAAGLDIVAIMSFHQAGGNVGDDYTAYLPAWIWDHYTAQGVTALDLKYVSETGAPSAEYVSLWADGYVIDEYEEFMNAFEARYASYAADIDEINISAGTAGESRYPSYNAHDWGGYPNRGTLQAYGRLAVEDFQNEMADTYGTVAALNAAWGSSLTSFSEIGPPTNMPYFFDSYDYRDSAYGRDFFDWYNQSLVDHGRRMVQAGIDAFDAQMADVALGIKIPGIHWTMSDPAYPRLAELTAGLIRTSTDNSSPSTGHGYDSIVSAAAGWSREVNLHFTCLEMGNDGTAPAYSMAQDLVFWVADAADRAGVPIKGENALAGGVTTHAGWDNIVNALTWASYSGLTVLRMEQVTWNQTGRDRYAGVIQQFDPTADTSVTVHYREFESAQSYTLHAWDGVSGDFPMTYECEFGGEHWWFVTLPAVPPAFSFAFVNSNNTWDGVNRRYSAQGDPLYVEPYSATVHTSRP